jgi:hypothetical protein
MRFLKSFCLGLGLILALCSIAAAQCSSSPTPTPTQIVSATPSATPTPVPELRVSSGAWLAQSGYWSKNIYVFNNVAASVTFNATFGGTDADDFSIYYGSGRCSVLPATLDAHGACYFIVYSYATGVSAFLTIADDMGDPGSPYVVPLMP